MSRETPFQDASLSEDARIDWLLEQMTIDEKLEALSGEGKLPARLGIPAIGLGGEAAHGVEARNDQNGIGVPETTTSFPQPIGMSASWDASLMREAGRIVGIEARVLAARELHHGNGLSRWAPTVDLERDPRWGRNEEGYGEDATLTGELAGAYVRGMRGDDPYYIRCGATLKHFYGNNTENGRGWKNASIDPRNRNELYLQPFLRVIRAGATGVMTAYNRINGTTGILNDEVLRILKEKYGLLHAVSDGGALSLVSNMQHEVGMPAEAIAGAIRAGVDSMSEGTETVAKAAREAYALGLLTEDMVDRALRNTWRFKLRLGLHDRTPRHPFLKEGALCSEEAQAVCRKLSEESLVLLKNEDGFLPLAGEAADDLAIIGPMGDAWYQDWYGGEPPRRTTLLQGIRQITGKNAAFDHGYDVVTLSAGGKNVRAAQDGTLVLTDGTPDEFLWMDWGEDNLTLRCVRTGKFVQSIFYDPDEANGRAAGVLAADKDMPFDWFVMEIFHSAENGDGTIRLTDRFRKTVGVEAAAGALRLRASGDADGQGSGADSARGERGQAADGAAEWKEAAFTVTTVSSGVGRAAALAKKKKRVVLALGGCSMICAKEEIDRKTIALPPAQRALIDGVCAENKETAVMLFSNYPYAFGSERFSVNDKPALIKEERKKVRAILWSATGSQDMGLAAAEALFGRVAPAGRLTQTWAPDDASLGDINDYDIIRGGKTYRYYEGETAYPFGFGLTYSSFAYSALRARKVDARTVEVRLVVENTGGCASDEVVQVYGIAPPSRVKKPLRQLLAFTRLHDVQPGERRAVALTFSTEEFAFYDTISGAMMTEAGTYRLYAGRHCLDEALSCEIEIEGQTPGVRQTGQWIRADHYDDCEGVELVKGAHGLTAVAVKTGEARAMVAFRDCALPGMDAEECAGAPASASEKARTGGGDNAGGLTLRILLRSEEACEVAVFVNGKQCGSFAGDTASFVPDAQFRENSLKEGDPQPARWPAVNCEIPIVLIGLPALSGRDEIAFEITGAAKLMRWKLSRKGE